MDTKRDPHSDNELIDEADELETPSHSGTSGGNMARSVSSRDEEKTATGADPQPTSIHKGQKPRDGDEPNLPNRDGGGTDDKAPPRRT